MRRTDFTTESTENTEMRLDHDTSAEAPRARGPAPHGGSVKTQSALNGVHIMLWATVALALTGNVLVIHHMPHGFVCWIVADLILAAHAMSCRHWPHATLWCVYMAIAVWGVVRWM